MAEEKIKIIPEVKKEIMPEEKKKRRDLSLREKRKILKLYDKLPKMSQRNAALTLSITQPLLCKILKNRIKIETAQLMDLNIDRKRERSGKDNQVGAALKIWFGICRENNVPINGKIMCQKAEELAKIMGKEGFVATDGWFNRWKRRENIVIKQVRGKNTSENSVIIPEICHDVTTDDDDDDDDSKTSKDRECNFMYAECLSLYDEVPPTNAEVQDALRVLRRFVQSKETDFEQHYNYEDYIQELINSNITDFKEENP